MALVNREAAVSDQTDLPENKPQGVPPSSSFDLNRPTIIAGLYALGYFTVFTSIIGIVLCYVWRSEPGQTWEISHYDYHMRTFWFGLAGSVIGFLLLIVLIGFLVLAAVGVWVIIRVVLSIVNAQKQEPMPNPHTLFF
jgi:uncharacterized membrane protein